MPTVVLQIGGRIRAERARKGISLRGLARSVGLSPSLISQIETGKCQPSVSTLYAITTALGISVQDVFGESRSAGGPAASGPAAAARAASGSSAPAPAASGPAGSPVPARAEPGPAAGGRAAGRPGQDVVCGQDAVSGQDSAAGPPPAENSGPLSGPGGPVACPGQREILELDSGVAWERLGHAPGSQVDFLLVSYAPGGCSSPAGHLMQHPGTEHGYLLRGELVVTLGSRSHRLIPGDSVSFTSATPHSYRNQGTVPAVGVWFVAGPDGA